MGFLDDLKRQAEALKAEQQKDTAGLERNTALAEVACRTAQQYFIALAPQLEVLKPRSPARFALDRRHVFENLPMTHFRVDSRMTRGAAGEVFDHIVIHWRLAGGQSVHITKDFVGDIEKLEPKLRQSGAQVDTEPVRNPDTGKLMHVHYRFVVDFGGSVRITPVHEAGRVQIKCVNLDGLETITAEFPATEIGSARLDELARWITGHPHAFLQGASALRRVEA